MNLDELAERERVVDQRVRSVTGWMEEKWRQLAAMGAFDEYREIHRGYVGLIGDLGASTEALKRALFIGWYAASEPGCFTGIGELDANAEARVFEELERRVAEGAIDTELRWMLRWYFRMSDFCFAARPFPVLLRYVASLNDAFASETVTESFDARGQMGQYWRSVAGGMAATARR